MANLWSETEKIFIGKENGDEAMTRSALERAVRIIEKIKNSGDKSAEIEAGILEDVLKDLGKPLSKYKVSRKELSSYFAPFALRTMRCE